MWNKLTHLVKPRSNNGGSDVDGARQGCNATPDALNASALTNGSVMSRVYEQHPNLSMFHSGSAVNLGSASPPASPSKGSKRSVFKRSLKAKLTSTPAGPNNPAASGDILSPSSSVWTSPSPVKLIPKKIRASLQIDTFTAHMTNITPAPGSAPLPAQPHTPTIAEHTSEICNPTSETSETQPTGAGSIRSILRDPNTPGTGQSVRFFSRDAYRVISPNASETEIDQQAIYSMDPEAFLEKLRSVSPENNPNGVETDATKDHTGPINSSDNVIDVFSPPRQDHSGKSRKPFPFQPRHPSRNHKSSNISSHSCSDSGSLSHSNSQSLSSLMIPPPPADMSNLFDVSQEHGLAEIPISIEGSLRDDAIEEIENANEREKISSVDEVSVRTLGRSPELAASPPSNATPHRDQSVVPPRSILSPEGTVFHCATNLPRAQGHTPSHSFPGAANDHTAVTMFFTPEAPDARIDNKTTFFTPEAGPLASPMHSQALTAYSQKDLVPSLRGQLELQRQLATQYEVDIAARDELVSLLSTQLQEAEAGADKYRKEVERRQSAMRALRRKVTELEKICCGLEEEVERSREESFERSVMDEASEGALVVLHGSIGQLKGELERAKEEEARMREQRDALKMEVENLTSNQLKETTADLLGERLSDEDKHNEELTHLRSKIGEKDQELAVLKAEVEAQWENTEKADEKIKGLEGEKEALCKSVEALHKKIEELGAEWKEGEVKQAELEDELKDAWSMKEEIERERDQLIEDVNFEREHAEQLANTLQERAAKLNELEQEQRYATDNVTRLEDLLRMRDAENAEAQTRIIEREEEAEQLRAQMHKMKREHSRLGDEQNRNLNETLQREEASKAQMEEMVRHKAEDDVAIGSMKEHLAILNKEVERLRRQVHGLQQESADKDIKLLQLTKARDQDKEDKEGLNIALDSKQQELELLKRKMGVKGTGGSTPALNRVGLPNLPSRRQSVAFVTPSAPRPRPSSTKANAETPLARTRFGSSLQGNSVTSAATPSTTKSVRPGSTAVRPTVPRRSVTPLSASTSSLARSTSTLSRSALPVSAHRRSSSVISTASLPPSEDGEKENAAPIRMSTSKILA